MLWHTRLLCSVYIQIKIQRLKAVLQQNMVGQSSEKHQEAAHVTVNNLQFQESTHRLSSSSYVQLQDADTSTPLVNCKSIV